MQSIYRHYFYRLRLLVLTGLTAIVCMPANAQLTPDTTLGGQNSLVTPIPSINADIINGGAVRGGNLFHSFTQFNVGNGQSVYFANPSGVVNIVSRVTGKEASLILGRLGVLGDANLFLINPNGILFGNNASLDIRGSFVGTTANGIQFGTSGVFSATNPEAPALLTINPSAFLFNQINPGAIINLSQANAGVGPTGDNVTGLRVPDGKSLLFVAGDININGGAMRAYEGNIELASIASPGIVSLNVAGDTFKLSISPGLEGSEILLNNGAEVNVRGANNGSIALTAKNITLTDESKLRAGIAPGNGTSNSKAGDIVVNATGITLLTNGSFIANLLQDNAFGKAGNIQISTGSLNLDRASQISAGTYGRGDGGDIAIQAKDSVSLTSSAIFNTVEKNAVGNSGNIKLEVGSLSLADSAEIDSKTFGQGNAGNITINARDAIILNGNNTNASLTRIISSVNPEGVGKAGDIQITTGSLRLSDNAFISSSTLGKGDSGNITIDARDSITFENGSYINNGVNNQAVGQGGEVRISTGTLSLTGGSQIVSNVLGQGNGGNIFVNARDAITLDGIAGPNVSGIQSELLTSSVGRGGDIQLTTGSLFVTNGATLGTGTDGQGNAGNITINARDTVTFDGIGKISIPGIVEGNLPSNAGSSVGENGRGNGGNIRINARSLFLKNGSQFSVGSFGQGDGGNIFIQASDLISITNPTRSRFAQIENAVYFTTKGNGGSVNIQAGELVLNNSNFLTSTFGQGKAGNISLQIRDSVSLTNSTIFSNVEDNAVGDGGNIDIQARTLLLNNSRLFTPTRGVGNAGKISIQTNGSTNINNNSFIVSSVSQQAVGNGGSIDIRAGLFSLSSQSAITTGNAGGKGTAGDISINSADSVAINFDSSITSLTSGQGNAGKIKLQAGNEINIANGSAVISNLISPGVGNAGDIEIQSRTFSLNNAGLQAATNSKGNAGNIFINTAQGFNIENGSVATSTDGQGNAGKIVVRSGENVSITGVNSSLFSIVRPNGVGTGGEIDIQAGNFILSDSASLLTSTLGQGDSGNARINATGDITINNGALIATNTIGKGSAGDVTVTAGGQVSLDGVGSDGRKSGIFTSVENVATGEGGDINLNARSLSINNNALLSSRSASQGNAGDINVDAQSVRLNNRGLIEASTDLSDGGNIKLTADNYLLLRRGSSVTTSAGFLQGGGNGGNISIATPFIVAVSKEDSDITANAFTGRGGNVDISVQSLFGIAPQQSPIAGSSDITASSQFGVQGQINISQPEVQPTQEILELPGEIIDATNQIAQTCPRGLNAFQRPLGQFTIIGRGSLPPSPFEAITSSNSVRNLATLDEVANTEVPKAKIENPKPEIVEAQRWVKHRDGSITLIAQTPQSTPKFTLSAICPSESIN